MLYQQVSIKYLLNRKGDWMSEEISGASWYVVHTYSGYENKVKANIEKTIENRHLEDQILEVSVPLQDAVEIKNGVKKQVQKKSSLDMYLFI